MLDLGIGINVMSILATVRFVCANRVNYSFMMLEIAYFPVLRNMVLITVVYGLISDILMVHRHMDTKVLDSFFDCAEIVMLRCM